MPARAYLRPLIVALILMSIVVALAACAHPEPVVDRIDISTNLEERTGHLLGPVVPPEEIQIPEPISLADGLSEDEAVAIALWNNPAFLADLAELGFAKADLTTAAMWKNPILALFFPTGSKQMEATLGLPIQELWLRPKRIGIAQDNLERVAASLVQNGLNLIQTVKMAYADLLRARALEELSAELIAVSHEVAELTEARLRAGDVSELEASRFRVAAMQAEEEATRLDHERTVARARLLALLGLQLEDGPWRSQELDIEDPGEGWGRGPELDVLLREALAARPDLLAVEMALEAAGKKAGLARADYLQLGILADYNEHGDEGSEIGPGVGLRVPIFNQNQGGVSQAEAELEMAMRRYAAVRNQIALEVREAHSGYLLALEHLDAWRGGILPELEEALLRSESALAAGDVSYLDFLQNKLLVLDARRRQTDAVANLRRAKARLESGVGRKLDL